MAAFFLLSARKNFRAAFRYNDIPLSRYSDLFEIISFGKMGSMGNLGLMGSEITKISSEQNKISSTLFKIIGVR